MGERISYILQCTDCKNKNYHFARGKRKEYKVELKKFCRACGKRTAHKETKSN
jgi:large subunit ribosomal protein L33